MIEQSNCHSRFCEGEYITVAIAVTAGTEHISALPFVNASSAEQLSLALSRVGPHPDLARQLHEILGDYCHQCRNLLSTMNMSLYLAKRAGGKLDDTDWSTIEWHYREAEQFIDRVQSICRPMSLSLVKTSLQYLFESRLAAWSETLIKKGRTLILQGPPSSKIGQFDPGRLERVFDDLVAWRAGVGDARTDLRIQWKTTTIAFEVVWDEPPIDGIPPGRPEIRRESGDAEMSLSLASLTIPMLSRVMSLHGGSLSGSIGSPWRICLSWPLAASPT